MASTPPQSPSETPSASGSTEFSIARGHFSAHGSGDEFWLWGGDLSNLATGDHHDSKKKHVVVGCYDPLLEVCTARECSGIPGSEYHSNGASAALKGSIYQYGGSLGVGGESLGNRQQQTEGALYRIDVKSWERTVCAQEGTPPFAQQLCKMVAFEGSKKEKRLALFGVCGPFSEKMSWSNKVHFFDLDKSEVLLYNLAR